MNNEKIITMQQLNKSHMNDLLSLATIVGWDYDEEEIQTLLVSGTMYGHITVEKTVIACAAIIPYGANLASIGMVIVHPDFEEEDLRKHYLLSTWSKRQKIEQ